MASFLADENVPAEAIRVAGRAVVVLALLASTASAGDGVVGPIERIGQAYVPGFATVEGTRVGGLSGLAFDAESGSYLAISDDRGGSNAGGAPRVYRLRIDPAVGEPGGLDVTIEGVTILSRDDGAAFPVGTVDAEGIALVGDSMFIGTEGVPSAGVDPFIARFDRSTGRELEALPLPPKCSATADGSGGVRENLGFESLTASPDGRSLFAATEDALIRDGPAATVEAGARVRILRYDLASGEPAGEYLYETEPIAAPPARAGGRSLAGLVELLAIDDSTLLALERSYSEGVGFSITLFEVSLGGATDIAHIDGLETIDELVAARKRPVLDLGSLGVPLTNLEGMAFGPDLPDGRRSLVMVADNNLSRLLPTQFLAFAVTIDGVPPEPSQREDIP